MPPSLDASAVRAWCRLSLKALGRAREEIDAINVYPVADGDTGTNLYLTAESAAQAVEAVFAGRAADRPPTLPECLRAMSHGALIGARGNSGTILAQLLRGMNEAFAPPGGVAAEQPGDCDRLADRGRGPCRPGAADGGPAAGRGAGPLAAAAGHLPQGPVADDGDLSAAVLRRALLAAADSAYEAVARPVEGTMLSVAKGAAHAARDTGGGLAEVVRAAHTGALAALAGTPGQLGVLRRAGVVDAGGLGLVAVLGALCEAVTGQAPVGPVPGAAGGAGTSFRHGPLPVPARPAGGGGGDEGGSDGYGDADGGQDAVPVCTEEDRTGQDGPAFEVIFLLEAADHESVRTLRDRLDALGNSLVVVGGDGLWHVHVHVDDVGAAVEAGIAAGRPYRIRVTHFGAQADRPATGRAHRAVVAVVHGDGLAGLCAQAGATVVAVRPGEQPAGGEIAAAIRRAHAREVVLLPNDTELRHAAGAAAEQARAAGVRVALIPTRSAVQGLAALAVHDPSRHFDEDVVAMTAAAGATRYAELAVAEHRSWTMAGICQAGDVLGLIDGDVAVIGSDLAGTAATVLDRMLAAGGELVTLIPGTGADPGLVPRLESHIRAAHLAVDTVSYPGGPQSVPLLIGVE
ncbi:DAK2 domain-containing protein [Actinacidiphila sp. ITFR-21]|uniref:DAK2 domain-containing protein n=1 Tax=Actinacidiphila sp. ITFR-21 TaxID=3075199 RepID=UPI00288AB33F|nr:DAK2 domain-containing protein [Streptomyces sp. ITFR-21]WNI18264.1 DAK2 domain-containing protein [Streptomyces sp. ITFR-21]